MDSKYLDFILKNSKYIIFLTLVLAIILGYLGFFKMGINPDLTYVVQKDREPFKMQVDFVKKKATTNILTVAIYAKGDIDGAKKVLKLLKNKFEESGLVKETVRFDLPELMIKYGLFSLKSDMVKNLIDYFENLKRSFRISAIDFNSWRIVGIALGKLEEAIENYTKRRGFNEYILVSPNQKMIIMNFVLGGSTTDVAYTNKAVQNLKKIAENIERSSGYKIRFTGSPMFTYESSLQVRKDFIITTAISIISITFLLYITLGSFFSVFTLIFTMLVSMAISMGIYYIVFGEINIVTSFVNAMVLGLGIDFGVHLVTRTNSNLREGSDKKEALFDAISHTFLPSLISGVTTSIAFLTMLFSKSPAFSQMGIMASIGIGIFFLITYILIPAFYSLFDKIPKSFGVFESFVEFVDKTRKIRILTIFVVLIGLAFSYVGYLNMSNYWYTPPGLSAPDTEASKTLEDITKSFGSVGLGEIAIATEDFSNIKNLEKKFKESGKFSSVYSVIDVVGDFSQEAIKKIKSMYGEIYSIVWDPIISTVFRKVGIYQQIIEMLKVIEESGNLDEVIAEIMKDLPTFFYSYNGKTYHLMYVEPKVDLYSGNTLRNEIVNIQKLAGDDVVLGYPMLFYLVMEEIKGSIVNLAFMIALFIVLTIVVATKSIKAPIYMLFIISFSILVTFGVVYFYNIHVTFMTLLMIPIMLGIGVDGMVHLYHTEKRGNTNMIKTEKAVVVSMLTTIAAFGSFMASKGKLLKNFGISVSVGLLITLIFTIYIFLALIERRKKNV